MNSKILLILFAAYLLGSIPSAVITSKLLSYKDIRDLGNGNMGAKNTYQQVGWCAGILVATVDITKGALAIGIARYCGAAEINIMIAGVCVVLGHDYPLFAHFHGGQGMAAIVGVLGMFFPIQTILGVVIFTITLLLSHNWDLSCALGFVLLVVMILFTNQSLLRTLYPFFLLPTIGLRKMLQIRQGREVTA